MRARVTSRLARLLRLHRTSDEAREQASWRQRFDDARASAIAWKTRAAELLARDKEHHDRVATLQDALHQARVRAASGRREIPSVALLREVFAHRLRLLPTRAGAAPAVEREEQFVRVSTAYRTSLDAGAGAAVAGAEQQRVDGVTWWVPPRTGMDRLPYHGILQTREVAIGGIMLDLGANIGRMAIPRVVLGDVTAAYCAEPDPLNYACLARTVVDNGLRGLVLPDQTAIGDRNGTVRLLRQGASGSFRVLTEAGSAANTVEVPCRTLDTWVEELGIDLAAVTFVKVDVEGFERRVVAGAGRVLACRHIAWQMEIKPRGLRNAGDDPAALYADLQRSFTHFIDLNRRAAGARVRAISQLVDALGYVDPDGKTDVLLFSAEPTLN